MGQSKLPAKCAECGLEGPPRKLAVKEGWVRVSYGGSTRAEWLCPPHGRDHREKQRKELQERPPPRLPRSVAALAALALASGAGGRIR